MIIHNKILPIGKYTILNLYGVLFTKLKRNLTPVETNHENIHTEQMKELGIISFIFLLIIILICNGNLLWLLLTPSTFYIWYGIEYLLIRSLHKKLNNAYHDVSFEEEAHLNDENLNYIKTRKRFSWLKYLKGNSYANK